MFFSLLLQQGLGLLGRAFSELCTQYPCAVAYGYAGCFDPSQMVGACLVLALMPLGIFSLAGLIIEVSHKVGET